MSKTFTLYIIHSSHTDVGYTDNQEKMKAHHIAFIREVLEIIQKEPRFKWNCESYWCVEQFLKEAAKEERQAFADAVCGGNIGLSASYLNMTDLVPAYVHHDVMENCRIQRESLGLKAVSAMTADINGYSWGFIDILSRQGVENLMSCIHTHHGYHPLFRKQVPFWWESPQGNRILVWNGEHYNLGNELGIAQTPWFEYTLQDGMTHENLSPHEKAVRRIRAYVDTIRDEGYDLDFAPVSVSGHMTDNSPPSLMVLDFIDHYNAIHTGITLRMCTLDEFFQALRSTDAAEKIPVYRGDWTDWWADGIGSTPADLIQYRRGARSFHIAGKLDPEGRLAPREQYKAALYNLMFYGEHTWGYSSSITEPFHPQVNNLDQWKRLYALKACEAAEIIINSIRSHYGETAISLHKELEFRAVNPHDLPVEDILEADLELIYGHKYFEVADKATGQSVPFQMSRHARGPRICIWLHMDPREIKTFIIRELPVPQLASAGLRAATGIEGVNDLHWRAVQDLAQGGCVTTEGIENRFFKIRFDPSHGIVSVFDKRKDCELLDPVKPYGAFTPIYEVTHRDVGEDYLHVRRNMGRSRKAVRTNRSVGSLYDVKVLENGPLYSRAELRYRIEGAQECALIVTAWKLAPKLEIDFRLHKESVWEPENLYLTLPFAGEEIYLDKAGAIMRPRIDQLPGTCVDFYAVQNGVFFSSAGGGVLVGCPDTPLIAMGPLAAHPVRLMGEGVSNNDQVYSWVMNNFWETNFKASLGGFYQFHYELVLTDSVNPQRAFAELEAINEGVLQFYMFHTQEE